MYCEYCGTKHNGEYGTGRFCSKNCAKGFSSKNKRDEINKKVSETLKLKYKEKKFKCLTCDRKFTTKKKLEQHFNSNIHNKRKNSKTKEEVNQILSKKRIEKIKQGYINSPNKIIVKLGKNEIKCDSKLEVAAIVYLKNIGEVNVNRCFDSIEYNFKGTTKRFLPDFITDSFLVEVKSTVGQSLSKKWNDYKEKIPFKKKALKERAEELGLKPLWLDKSNSDLRKIYSSFMNKKIENYFPG